MRKMWDFCTSLTYLSGGRWRQFSDGGRVGSKPQHGVRVSQSLGPWKSPHIEIRDFPGAVQPGRGGLWQSRQMCQSLAHTPIAINVIKNSKFYRQQAKREVRGENLLLQVWCQHTEREHSSGRNLGFRRYLIRLKNQDHDKCSIIRIHGAFSDRGCYCMIFEHLDRSLFDYMNQQHLYRLPLLSNGLSVR